MTTTRGDRAPMTHRGHDHDDTKAARARCRRAIYALRAEIKAELEEGVIDVPGHRIMNIHQPEINGGRYVITCTCGNFTRVTKDLSLCNPYMHDHLRELNA